MKQHNGRSFNRILTAMIMAFAICLTLCLPVMAGSKDMTNPQNTAKTVVEAYIRGNTHTIRQCYTSEAFLSDEVDFETRFYEAVNPVDYKITGTETLWTSNNYSYVGVAVIFTVKGDEILPYYAYFLTKKVSEDEYRIVIGEETPSWAEEKIVNESVKYRETALYTDTMGQISNTENTAEYLDEIYNVLMTPVLGMTDNARVNIEYLGVTFGVMIVELGILLLWVIWITNKRKKRHQIVDKSRADMEASFRRTIHNFEPEREPVRKQ